MKMSILMTARCNASCSHCSTNCGPHRTDAVPRDVLFRLIDEAAAVVDGERTEIYLSGGEPFLDFALLLELIAHAKEKGALVTCVTNGYWATSHEKACAMLQAVKDAGLVDLAVSSSRFHEEFVSRKRVERVLAAAKTVGIRCTVKHVSGCSDRHLRKPFEGWAKAAGAFQVQHIDLLPSLRSGANVPASDFPKRKGLPRGGCPARLLSIAEDGDAYTCCTPGGFVSMLRLGNVKEASLQDLRAKFYTGATQQAIWRHGPRFFARAVQRAGLAGRLRESYGGACDLCTHIANDAQMSAVAIEAAQQLESRRLRGLFSQMIEKTTAGAETSAAIQQQERE